MASGLYLALALLGNLFSIITLSIVLNYGILYNQFSVISSTLYDEESCVIAGHRMQLRYCNFGTAIGENAWTLLLASGSTLLGMLVYAGLRAHEYYLEHQPESPLFPLLSRCTQPLFRPRRRPDDHHEAPPRPFLGGGSFALMTLVGAQCSATALALFGPQQATLEINGPIFSAPTAAHAAQVQEYDEFGASDLAQLRQVLTRSAFTHSEMRDRDSWQWAYKMGSLRNRLGDTLYPEMTTHGVGVNMAALDAYNLAAINNPLLDRTHALPPAHRFRDLEARILGTEVEVACEPVTATCATPHAQGAFAPTNGPATERPALYELELACPSIPGMEPLVLIQDRSQPLRVQHQLVPSPSPSELLPTHVFALQDIRYDARQDWWYQRATVIQCRYAGAHDVLVDVSLSSLSSPLKIGAIQQQGAALTAAALAPAIRNVSALLGPDGGPLAQALRPAMPASAYAEVLVATLTEAAQAYWSLKRQHTEVVAGWGVGPGSGEGIREGRLRTEYTRIGGGGWGWLTTVVVLLGLAVGALARSLAAWWVLVGSTDDEWMPLAQTEGEGERVVGGESVFEDDDEPASLLRKG
ncbi:hypothetical protein F5B20DRAFT_590115 [Whalleya microplaca]|nr:hypothetical protein F5B20DRAFT_590115 [Whalleya microplaca]